MKPSQRPTSVRWIIFVLACGASFLLYLHRYTWNVIKPKLQEAPYNLTHSQDQLLFSLFYYTYAILQIPSGVLIDRWGPRWFLSLSILLWSLSLAALGGLFFWAPAGGSSLVLILVVAGGLRFLFGAAQAGCYPALTRASRVWFAPEGRTTLQGLIASTAGRSGAALSPIILSSLLMGWLGMSWQAGLILFGLLGLALGVVFFWGFTDSPESDPRANDAERWLIRGEAPPPKIVPAQAPAMLPWGNAMRSGSMWWFVGQQFFDAGSDVAFVALMGGFFKQRYGLDFAAIGWLVALPLIGGALGGWAGGWLNERCIAWSGSRRWGRSGVGFVGKLLGCAMLLLVSQQESAVAAGMLLLVAKFFGDWSQPTTWGCCTDMGGPYSATVFSIINTAGTAGGMVMPLIFGRLLDWFTREVQSGELITKMTDWNPLFYLLAGMYLTSGIFWLAVDCTQSLEDNPKA